MKKIFLALLVLACFAGAAFAQPANCVNPTTIAVPFAKDGAGEFCFAAPCMGTNINSWNLDLLEINGVNYTNKYCDGVYNCGAWPAPINGLYYVHYKGSFAWSHFEIVGACSGTTAAPTAIPTAIVTTPPSVTPVPGVGQVSISPASQTVTQGTAVTIEIHANTGTTALGAFGFTVTYPTNIFTFGSIAEIATGLNLTNNTATAGKIVTAGFNASGVAGSTNLSLIRITLNTVGTGTGAITLTVQNLNDTAGAVIGTPSAASGSVVVNPGGGTPAPTSVPGVGQVSINPASQSVASGTAVTIEIHANTGTTALGAFGFTVTYPTANFTFGSIAEIASGLNLTNNTATAGKIVTAGFNATGVAGSSNLSLIKITLNAITAGTGTIGLTVQNLNDTAGAVIGTPSAVGGTVTVTSGATPAPGVGQVSISPASQSVAAGTAVTIDIHANTGTSALGAFGFTVTYPTANFTFGTITEIASGLNLTNNTATAGKIVTAGFNASGIAGSSDLALIRITLNATTAGTGAITLTVQNLNDTAGAVIGTPSAVSGTVTVTGTATAAPTAVPTAVVTVAPTAVPPAGVGQVSISPASQSVGLGTVTLEIHANTGASALGAFGFTVTYPTANFTFGSIAEIASGLNLTNNTATAGKIVTAGFNASGIAGSSDLALIRITLNAISAGTGAITLTVQNLNDTAGAVIGTPSAVSGTVTVNGTATAAPTSVPTAIPTVAPTAVPPAGLGQVSISPASQSIAQGTAVTIEIHANTGSSLLGAFGFTVTYPTANFTFGSIAEITSGLNLTNNTATAGKIVTAGFNASGVAGSTNLALIRITLNTIAAGTGAITLTVQNLNDTTGAVIGTPSAVSGTVTVTGTATAAPTAVPTVAPTAVPTAVPTVAPTAVPTAVPTVAPTAVPTVAPTAVPTVAPTAVPTVAPTAVPSTQPGPGGAWMIPASQTVANGTTGVKVVIHVNTGTSLIAAYGINVTYNSAILGSPAAAAESTGFMSAAGFATAGTAKISGFDTTGKGPSTDLALFNVTFTAIGTGSSTMGVQVGSFVDASTVTIGTPVGVGGTITVN